MTIFDLSGTVALVTGATGGIGRAAVRGLADAGARVIATDLAEAASVDGAAAYYRLDVVGERAWEAMIADIAAREGRLDILVNNAGISLTGSIAETSLDDWRKCQTINVDGVFLGTRAAAPLLRESGANRKGGSAIVNLSSVGGLVGAPFMAGYCASKGAVRLFTKSAAAEYARLGWPIRVNSVHPGAVDTDMMETIYARYVETGLFADADSARDAVAKGHAVGRTGSSDEIAAGIVYLCSGGASFVTGAELAIDGGMTAQ